MCGAEVNAYGGCTIGGSSAINAGLFFEPPASDWDLYFPAEVSDNFLYFQYLSIHMLTLHLVELDKHGCFHSTPVRYSNLD